MGYVLEVQDLVRVFLNDTTNRCVILKKYSLIFGKSTNFITQLAGIIEILEQINRDMYIPCVSAEDAQKARGDLIYLQNSSEQLKKEIKEAASIDFYTPELATQVARRLNISLAEIFNALKHIQVLIWHSFSVYIEYCEPKEN